MLFSTFLTCIFLQTTGVTITEPVDGDTYDGDWLTVRVILENENELPDSVHYTLNEGPVIQIPRLNTDWYTYMGNDSHTGHSESPAPLNANMLWSKDIQSHLSPVVADGMLFCQAAGCSDSLQVLNASTGDLIWKFYAGESLEAISTVKDGFAYVPGDSLWCLDSATGERIWANGNVDMSGNTPAVFDGKVYSARSLTWGEVVTYLYCFDAYTGACLWNDTLPGRLYSASK
ncbi:MAG: PQQ-binding-like beta-propeller repeat protein [Candidatus Sabulitectum sp.]|nr:PQQ-binding-like beta-propeller repeat protein [Candidatus Sabulitectum sp.]